MTHYEVLGVAANVPADQLRKAYLAAARAAHPDLAGPSGERRMRDVNAAWAILGDARRRAEYDRTIASAADAARRGTGGPGGAEPAASGPSPTILRPPERRPFVPAAGYGDDDDDLDEDAAWRYEEDETDPETAAGIAVQFLPLVLVLVGIIVIVGGLWIGLATPGGNTTIAVVGVMILLLGFVGLLAAPLIAMGRAKSVEERRDERRR